MKKPQKTQYSNDEIKTKNKRERESSCRTRVLVNQILKDRLGLKKAQTVSKWRLVEVRFLDFK